MRLGTILRGLGLSKSCVVTNLLYRVLPCRLLERWFVPISWDCTINVWKTSDINVEDDLVSKKRKVDGQVEDSQLEGEASTTLVGHTQCVSSMVWPQRESIYFASWDHSIRKWDAETGKNLSDIVSGLSQSLNHTATSCGSLSPCPPLEEEEEEE